MKLNHKVVIILPYSESYQEFLSLDRLPASQITDTLNQYFT